MEQKEFFEQMSEIYKKEDVFNKSIPISENLNFHLSINKVDICKDKDDTDKKDYIYIFSDYFKYLDDEMIYYPILFLPENLLTQLKDEIDENLANDNIEEVKRILSDKNDNFNEIIQIIKIQYELYKKLFNTDENIKYELDNISLNAISDNFEDVLDIEILEKYNQKELYHTISIDLPENNKIVCDFYKITDEYKGIFYTIVPIFIDNKNEGYNMKEYFPLLLIYFLGFFEYRNYSVGYKNLVNNIEKILKGDDYYILSGNDFNVKNNYKEIIDYYNTFLKDKSN